MKGGWVIDCAVRVTGVSMTQAASEPWGNFTPNSSVRDRSYSRVHDICQIPICLDLSSSTVRIGLLCTWCIWGLQWNRHLSCTDQTQAADVAGHVVRMNHRRHHWSRETCLRQESEVRNPCLKSGKTGGDNSHPQGSRKLRSKHPRRVCPTCNIVQVIRDEAHRFSSFKAAHQTINSLLRCYLHSTCNLQQLDRWDVKSEISLIPLASFQWKVVGLGIP